MSDNDFIRRGDVLREIANEGLHILDAAIAALPARGVRVDVEEVARAIYDAMRFERKDKTPEWVKGGNSNAQVEARSTAARILAALSPTDAPDLSDPVTVHVNMLRGTIAKPTVEQIVHLYGREAFQPMIDAAISKALEKACLAVSEHADWPEDEHGRTEQVGLFARVINAIRAITPALSPAPTEAAHVNETPKSEHDGADVLTDAAQAREAALKEAAEAWEAFKAANTTTDHFAAVDRLDAILRAMAGRE